MSWAGEVAQAHLGAFNQAVACADYAGFLQGFSADVLMRFENVPGAGVLEFSGRQACVRAYEQRPPGDQIDLAGTPTPEGGTVSLPFAWRRTGEPGVIELTMRDGKITVMVVRFG